MSLSLNQIEQIARKAARGAGLGWGLAEDAGRAVRWLEMSDMSGLGQLLDLLTNLDHDVSEGFRVDENDGVWTAAGGTHSPLIAGPSLMDWLPLIEQGPGHPTITLDNVAAPLLCVGYIGFSSRNNMLSVRVSWRDVEVRISPNSFVIHGSVDQLLANTTEKLTVSMMGSDSPEKTGQADQVAKSRQVDPHILQGLEQYVKQTYVEATEASRLAGAGAGLSDND